MMSEPVAYQLLDNDEVVLYVTKDYNIMVSRVFSYNTRGILCNDLKTYINFDKAVETDFTD
tara:strand:+ start:2296 stop:2478 length:183 start_codon:yes stop_codon:yes gene_type:complete